ALDKRSVTPEQHFTQPPPRYTEATLVKRMEELGIGRPSTYASIVTTIQDRGYVTKDKNRLIAQDKGRLVTIFLVNYFRRYLEYDFTAALEEQLDDVSAGDRDYKDVLDRFWRDFSAAISETAELRITEVLEKIDEVLAPHLYPAREDGSDPRSCPKCGLGRLNLKTARSGGAFIGCNNYPECRYTRPLAGDEGDAELSGDGKLLGHDAGDPISLRTGRFGPYVQRGEVTTEQPKPPRASLPKGWQVDSIDLERALMLLSLPRPIGPHPEDGEMIEAGIGRYGPYVKHGRTYANLPEVEEVFTIGMNRAVEVLAAKPARGRAAATEPLRVLGDHPSGGAISVMKGRYGPYVKWEKVNATLTKDLSAEEITLEQAVELVHAKAGAKPRKAAAKKPATKTAAAKKPAAKKAPAKKPAAKKAGKAAQ
ncbi:MAG: topoisomerase C-terminal repeat-containing protein, partial [Roseinatronobacter sp.]